MSLLCERYTRYLLGGLECIASEPYIVPVYVAKEENNGFFPVCSRYGHDC